MDELHEEFCDQLWSAVDVNEIQKQTAEVHGHDICNCTCRAGRRSSHTRGKLPKAGFGESAGLYGSRKRNC